MSTCVFLRCDFVSCILLFIGYIQLFYFYIILFILFFIIMNKSNIKEVFINEHIISTVETCINYGKFYNLLIWAYLHKNKNIYV